MLILMQRDTYKTVTLPILIRCGSEKSEGMATFLTGFESLRGVRSLTDEDFDRNSKVGLENWKLLSDDDRKRFCGIAELIQAVRAKDSLAASTASQKLQHLEPDLVDALSQETFQLIVAFNEGTTTRPDANSFAGLLSRTLSEATKTVALVLWRKGTEIIPALYCPTIGVAFYLRALMKSSSGTAFRICPRCGDPYLQQQSNQEYCSIRCREAYRVARWRANKERKKERPSKRVNSKEVSRTERTKVKR
jgi:hypothetical protein